MRCRQEMQWVPGLWRVTAGTLNVPSSLQGADHAVPSWEHLGVVAMGPQSKSFTPKGALLPALEKGAVWGPGLQGLLCFHTAMCEMAATKLQKLHPP